MILGITSCLMKWSFRFLLFFLVVTFMPGLPPDLKFSYQSYISKELALEGALKINNKLDGAEKLFVDELIGPEAIEVYNDELYTGTYGGYIFKIDNNKLSPVVKLGKPCEDIHDEDLCGRILGFKFTEDGLLYAADAYYGIFRVNMSNIDEVQQIVNGNDVVHGKKRFTFPNSLDLTKDGKTMFWSSSSSIKLSNSLYSLLSDGDGRLLKTNLETNTHEVLLDDLQFSNGVVLAYDESYVLVVESGIQRVLRYYLKGPMKGTHDIFVDNLPGNPDNIRRDDSGGYFISLINQVDAKHPNIFKILRPYPYIRKFACRFLVLLDNLFEYADEITPSTFSLFKWISYKIGHLKPVSILLQTFFDRYTTVRVNKDGRIVDALHSTDGNVKLMSDIIYFKGAYYLGSPFNHYLVKKQGPPPSPIID